MSTPMDRLLAQKAKTEQRLHKAELDDKKLSKQIEELRRKERTHRLITRGAYLEKLLIEPELFTDEEVFSFLDYALKTPYVKEALEKRLNEKRQKATMTEGNKAVETVE